MNRALTLSLLVCLLLEVGGSEAATLSLANRVADQLRAAIPDYKLTVVDELTIKVGKSAQPSEQPVQINLDRVANYCDRTPDRCDSMVSDFVAKIIEVIKQQEFTPTVAKLRAVVRPATYPAQMNELLAKKGDEIVSAPFAGDLVEMCYFDEPTAMRPALASDFAKIGLSRERAFRTGLDNTRAAMPRIPAVLPTGMLSDARAFSALQGDPYDSSYLLLHDDWAPLAQKLGGRLLVAAPDADLLLFGRDGGVASREALSVLAKDAYGKAERPISSQVFRWTPSGWEVVVP